MTLFRSCDNQKHKIKPVVILKCSTYPQFIYDYLACLGFGFVTFADDNTVDRVCRTRFFNIDNKTVQFYVPIYFLICVIWCERWNECVWWETWVFRDAYFFIQVYAEIVFSMIFFRLKLGWEVFSWEHEVKKKKIWFSFWNLTFSKTY